MKRLASEYPSTGGCKYFKGGPFGFTLLRSKPGTGDRVRVNYDTKNVYHGKVTYSDGTFCDIENEETGVVQDLVSVEWLTHAPRFRLEQRVRVLAQPPIYGVVTGFDEQKNEYDVTDEDETSELYRGLHPYYLRDAPEPRRVSGSVALAADVLSQRFGTC